MGPSKNLGVDLGTSGDLWLFRQAELVLGPVPAAQVIERLYSGELDGKSEVSRLGSGRFQKISEVEFFRVHVAKAEAKLRVEAQARNEEARGRLKRNIRIGIVAGIAVAVAGIVAWGVRYLVIHKPWTDPDEVAYADITVEPPKIGLARRQSAEELLEYQTGSPARPSGSGEARPDKPDRTQLASARSRPANNNKMSDPGADPDGMQMGEVDQAAIQRVVSSKQKTLFPCLVEEAKRQPGLSAKIPIEFAVGADGRVSKVWVDHPQFKSGSLPQCFLRELQKWPFRPQDAGATISLSFKIGKG